MTDKSHLTDEELAQLSIDKVLGKHTTNQLAKPPVKKFGISKSTKSKLGILVLMYSLWAFSLMEFNPVKWSFDSRALISVAIFISLLVDYVVKDINSSEGVHVMTDEELKKKLEDWISKNE